MVVDSAEQLKMFCHEESLDDAHGVTMKSCIVMMRPGKSICEI
jgi:hypothetical protein